MMRTSILALAAVLALTAMATPASAEPMEPMYGCVANEKFVEAKACYLIVPGKCPAVGFRVGDLVRGMGQCT